MTRRKFYRKALVVFASIFVMFLLLLFSKHAVISLSYQLHLGSLSIPLLSDNLVIFVLIITQYLCISYHLLDYPDYLRINSKRRKIVSTVFDYFGTFIIALYFINFFFILIAFPVTVNQTSMMPSIIPGEKLIISTDSSNLERGDIVVFEIDSKELHVTGHDGEFWIKRVIGLPGERIEFIDGHLYVNGEKVLEEYLMDGDSFKVGYRYDCMLNLDSKACKTLEDVLRLTGLDGDVIPSGYYLLMGDNRLNSYDSWSIGLVSEDLIVGRAVYRINNIFKLEKIK